MGAGRQSSYMPDMTRKRAFRIGRSRTGFGPLRQRRSRRELSLSNTKAASLRPSRPISLRPEATVISTRSTVVGQLTERAYANHSCRPNAETHRIGHKVIIRAIKNIKAGAEITYNYGRDYLTNVITRRGCKCDKCRKKRADARAKARAESRRARPTASSGSA
jgi:SET domain-containing protein